jgi:choline-sulfatase
MVNLMQGETETWRTKWNNETVSHFGNEFLMIKWDAIKYQYYGEEMPEVLFDLERDPDETQNLIDDPRYADLLPRFRRRRAALGYGPDADAGYVNAGYWKVT